MLCKMVLSPPGRGSRRTYCSNRVRSVLEGNETPRPILEASPGAPPQAGMESLETCPGIEKKKGACAAHLAARVRGDVQETPMQSPVHTSVQEGRRAVVCTLANQKGGMTKTTTTVNIATMLTLLGYKVLVVDCAPEAHTTFTFGYSPGSMRSTLFDVLEGSAPLRTVVLPTYCNPQTHAFFDPQERSNPDDPASKTLLEDLGEAVISGPDLVPLNNLASSSDMALRRKMMWATLLKNVLEPARRVYDYIVIDTNPSLGVWTVNEIGR